MESKNDYQNLVKEREKSGISVKEYCKEKGIQPSVYYYWRKKMMAVEGKEKKFHLINVIGQESGSGGIRILYPNGVQLEIYREMNLSQIKELLDVRL